MCGGAVDDSQALPYRARDQRAAERLETGATKKGNVPALAKLKQWLDENLRKITPDGLTGKALRYTLNQWSTLAQYTEHPALHISNVLA